MAKRTGIPSLLHLSQRLCIFIIRYSPVINALSGDPAVAAALSNANTACAALADALAPLREIGD